LLSSFPNALSTAQRSVGRVDPLRVEGLATLDTFWSIASGSFIKPVGPQYASHYVLPSL